MKSKLLKVISLICCLALCAGALIACADKKDNTDEVPAEEKASISAVDQKATEDGEIIISYYIPDAAVDKYESFEARVYHNDSNNNLLCATELDPEKNAAYIATSYGKLRLDIVGKTSGGIDMVLGTGTVSVWADEYNFASLNGTFPVVYFTLELFSMSGETCDNYVEANAGGKNIQFINNVPTFISLERTAAYNWDALPNNVYTLPNTTYEKSIEGDFHGMNAAMAEYIKELNEVNPDSKFHFYCVDNYPELIVNFFIAQGIDSDHFDATMISDGTATVSAFNKIFAGEDGEQVYNNMAESWNTIKEKAAAGEKDYFDGILNAYSNDYHILFYYAFVMAAEEDNIQWWISRDLFTENAKSQFIKDKIAEMKGKTIQIFGINDMLSTLSEDDQVNLKTLFHFDGEMFSDAEKNGKKILIILGTRTQYEENFQQYLTLVNELYGAEYQIYYKGHPGTPTGLDLAKAAMFAAHGVTDIDSSIAAELILFYCPDVYLVGWASTTYKAAQEDKILALFNQTKESGLGIATTDGYGDTPDSFYSIVTKGDKTYVKIEYAENDTVKYFDFAAGGFVDQLPE